MMRNCDVDALCEDFDERWAAAGCGVSGVESFLLERIASPWPCELVDSLIQIDLERAWIGWNNEMESIALPRESASSNGGELPLRMRALPQLVEYEELLAKLGCERRRIEQLATMEYQLRNECGDMIGPEFYRNHFNFDLAGVEVRSIHHVYSVDSSELLPGLPAGLPLRGLNLFGRRRSTDAKDLILDTRPEGNRIVIAPVTEQRVSRQQLSLHILAPGIASLRNESSINAIAVGNQPLLEPESRRELRFPFTIYLPGGKLEFR